MIICERCGGESPGGFRFCGRCGAPLPAAPARETRKVVTVLFSDATGWTALGDGLDPEALRAVMSPYFKEIRATIERHGGTVEKFIGDAVMAVFGIPRVHEDDALRAVRAAAEIRERLPAVAEAVGLALRFRTGVNTGTVFTGEGETLVVGDAVNVAARLEQAAQPGEVLLGAETLRLVREAVDVEAIEPLQLKGKSEPVRAFKLLGVRSEPGADRAGWQLPASVATGESAAPRSAPPMVGRDGELASARAVFEQTVRAGRPHLLTVLGDPGIGKSRLAAELAGELAAEASVLVGRCLSYGQGISFWPLREALTQAAGDESRDAVRGLLDGADDADAVADIVASTLGLGMAESVGEQVQWAFRRLFELLGSRRPTLLVIEDVHWAEEPLLDLVENLIESLTAPLLVLCAARPELLDVRPEWRGRGERVSSLMLRPLSEADTLRLLAHRISEQPITDDQRAQILSTSEGNPLFVEQLLAASAEAPWSAGEVPATIESLLAARLDRLGPGERSLVERAAVIGREFPPAAVDELLPEEERASAGAHWRALAQRGLINEDAPTLEGEAQLRFHHILIRDVAYRSTPKALRSELHVRFADWLEQRHAGYEEFVGHHLEQAFGARQELGNLDDAALSVAVRGGGCLAAAGRRGLSRGDAHAAVALLRRARALFEAGRRPRPEVLSDLGTALTESGDYAGAERALRGALEEAQAMGSEESSARVLIELSYLKAVVDPSVPAEESEAVAEQAIGVFERLGDDEGLARALLLLADARWQEGRFAQTETVLERALEHAERAKVRRVRSRILSGLACTTVIGPRPVSDGIRRCNQILEQAGDDVRLIAFTNTMLAVLEAMQGRFADARSRWRESKRRLEEVGLDVTVALLGMYSGYIEILAGTQEQAEQELLEAYERLERIGEQSHLATIAALIARLLYTQGRYEESERYVEISRRAAASDDVVTQVSMNGTYAGLLARRGEHTRAEQLADGSVGAAAQTDFLMLHADALSGRAEVLALLGRTEASAEDLSRSIELYERKGITVAATATRRLYRSLTTVPDRRSAPVQAGGAGET